MFFSIWINYSLVKNHWNLSDVWKKRLGKACNLTLKDFRLCCKSHDHEWLKGWQRCRVSWVESMEKFPPWWFYHGAPLLCFRFLKWKLVLVTFGLPLGALHPIPFVYLCSLFCISFNKLHNELKMDLGYYLPIFLNWFLYSLSFFLVCTYGKSLQTQTSNHFLSRWVLLFFFPRSFLDFLFNVFIIAIWLLHVILICSGAILKRSGRLSSSFRLGLAK